MPKNSPTDRPEPAPPVEPGELPDRVKTLYAQSRAHLNAGRVDEAFAAVRGQVADHALVKNVLGVCLMRLGRSSEAVPVLRPLAMNLQWFVLRKDVPLEFKTNYITALLLSGKVHEARGMLIEIDEHESPMVSRLHAALQKWRRGLSVSQKLQWLLGLDPARPVELDWDPGDLP